MPAEREMMTLNVKGVIRWKCSLSLTAMLVMQVVIGATTWKTVHEGIDPACRKEARE